MYEQFFHFNEHPFTIAPNPRYLYLSDQHREALAHLTYGLKEENGGFILLVGEVGTGKTTVCRCLLEQVPESARLAMILNPRLNDVELLETICAEFDIEYPRNATVKTLIDILNSWLLNVHAAGQRAVVVIEEAQNLSIEVLEQLRLLTNLETNERKLLQIVLIGQTELLTTLACPELRQLSQRIIARYHLHALNQQDIHAYIAHRLQVAGGSPTIFSSAAVRRIAQLSKGLPRLINLLCDRALLGCYAQGKYKVDFATVNQAAREVFGEKTNAYSRYIRRSRFGIWAGTMAGIVAVLIITAAYFSMPPKLMEQMELAVNEWSFSRLFSFNDDASMPIVSELLEEQKQPIVVVPPLIEEALAEADAQTPERLTWDSLKQGSWGESAAYQAAFNYWGVTMEAGRYTPCEFAQRNAMDCWHKRGSFSDIRRLNRPVVLKMFSQEGKVFYAALLSVGKTAFRLGVDAQIIELPRRVVERLWSGEYTVLWKRPSGYTRTVRPGDYNVLIGWLKQQLGLISGQAVVGQSQSLIYDAGLIAQVRKFQRLCRLQVDGLLGKETIIMFNTINSKVPILSKQLGSCPRRLNI